MAHPVPTTVFLELSTDIAMMFAPFRCQFVHSGNHSVSKTEPRYIHTVCKLQVPIHAWKSKTAHPVPTMVFLNLCPDMGMQFALFRCTHPPPFVPPLLFTQSLSTKTLPSPMLDISASLVKVCLFCYMMENYYLMCNRIDPKLTSMQTGSHNISQF